MTGSHCSTQAFLQKGHANTSWMNVLKHVPRQAPGERSTFPWEPWPDHCSSAHTVARFWMECVCIERVDNPGRRRMEISMRSLIEPTRHVLCVLHTFHCSFDWLYREAYCARNVLDVVCASLYVGNVYFREYEGLRNKTARQTWRSVGKR